MYPGLGADVAWLNIKAKLLGDPQLLNRLKGYEVSKTKSDQAKRAKQKMGTLASSLSFKDPEDPELINVVNGKNKATGALFKWCRATLKCYDIFKKVEPLKQNAEKMKKAKEAGEKELAETEKNLAALNASLAELNAGMKVKKDELDELQRVSAEMTRKLTAASTLINGLGSEQVRWSADMIAIQEDKVKLVGDCLTGSAFLSYCGPFNSILRQKMIFGTWK